MNAASLEAFNQGGWDFEQHWKVSLPTSGALELDDLEGPFQPKPFSDSDSLKGYTDTNFLDGEKAK